MGIATLKAEDSPAGAVATPDFTDTLLGASGLGALFALMADGFLVTLLIRMGLAANRRGDVPGSSAARRFFIAAPLVVLGTLARVFRYLSGGAPDPIEVAVTASLQAIGWALVLMGLEKLVPARGAGARTATFLLVGMGALSGAFVVNPGREGDPLVQTFLGVSFGLLAAVYAGLNLRLKALGERGWLPAFAMVAAELLLLVILLRAFLSNGATDSVKAFLRVFLTGGALLTALFAYPAFAELTARLDPHHEKAIRAAEADG